MSFRVTFFVPGPPVGKGRARSTRSGHHYTPAKTRNFEALVSLAATEAMQGRPLVLGPVALGLRIEFGIPVSWSEKKKRMARFGELRPTTKPDCSNIIKAVEDACNGVVYVDDVQIVTGSYSKQYAERPGITVEIEAVT